MVKISLKLNIIYENNFAAKRINRLFVRSLPFFLSTLVFFSSFHSELFMLFSITPFKNYHWNIFRWKKTVTCKNRSTSFTRERVYRKTTFDTQLIYVVTIGIPSTDRSEFKTVRDHKSQTWPQLNNLDVWSK